MKMRTLFLLALMLFSGTLAARSIQIPVELNNSSGSDGRQMFVVALPLSRGAVDKVENIRLSNADGKEIPAQFSIVDRWDDGSLRRVRICGFIRLKKNEERKIFVEYGSGVLHSIPPGMIVARSHDRMSVESGRLALEFALDRFDLPQKITWNKRECGTFLPFNDKSEGEVSFTEIEKGALYTIIQMEKVSACRIYFFYDEPWFAVEWLKGPAVAAKFSGNRNFKFFQRGGASGNWQIFRFDGKSAKVPLPLIGVLPEWYYEKCGIIVPDKSADGGIRDFEREIFQKIRARNFSGVPLALLFQSFFRTGDSAFIRAALVRNELAASDDDVAWLKCFYAGFIAGKKNAHSPELSANRRVVPVDKLSRYLSGMERRSFSAKDRFLAGGGILLRAFDSASGKWVSLADMRGAPAARDCLPVADNIRCARIMFQLEALTREARYGEAGMRAVERILTDGVTDGILVSGEIFQLFDAVREYLVRHPAPDAYFDIDAVRDRFMTGASPRVQDEVKLVLRPGETVKLLPRNDGVVSVKCGNRGGECQFELTDMKQRKIPSGFPVADGTRRIKIPAGGCILKYRGANMATLSVAGLKNCRIFLALGDAMRTFSPDMPTSFRFTVPQKCGKFTLMLRALKQGERANVLLISPRGKRWRVADFNADGTGSVFARELDISNPEAGVWQLILHCSGGDAALGIRGFHANLTK